jgi:hypothetical protein
MDEGCYVDEEMEPDPALNRITNAIIGAGIEVHRTLGPGHLESAYEEAMAVEMGSTSSWCTRGNPSAGRGWIFWWRRRSSST